MMLFFFLLYLPFYNIVVSQEKKEKKGGGGGVEFSRERISLLKLLFIVCHFTITLKQHEDILMQCTKTEYKIY